MMLIKKRIVRLFLVLLLAHSSLGCSVWSHIDFKNFFVHTIQKTVVSLRNSRLLVTGLGVGALVIIGRVWNKISILKAHLEQTRIDLNKADGRVKDESQRNIELVRKFAAAKATYESQVGELNRQLQEGCEVLREKEECVRRLEEQNNMVCKDLVAHQIRECEQQGKISELQTERALLCDQNKAHKKSVETLEERVRRLEGQNSRMCKDLAAHRDQLETLVNGPDPREHPFVRAGIIDCDGNACRDDLTGSITLKPDEETSMIEGDWVDLRPDLESDVKLYDRYHFASKIINKHLLEQGKILFACIHGTFSTPASFGGDEKKETTQRLIAFGKVLSRAYNCAVELISFGWSGSATEAHRAEAGRLLGGKLYREVNNGHNVKQIWTYSHSHGANVANFAAEAIREKGRHIDVGIHVASPVSDINRQEGFEFNGDSSADALPLNFKHRYNFYGVADLTQVIGSLITDFSLQRKAPHKVFANMAMHNIRVQHGGQEVDHVTIKRFVARYLPQLLFKISTYYQDYPDLDVNLSEEGTHVAIRDANLCYPHRSVMPRLTRALAYSEMQKNKFQEAHGRSIEGKFEGHNGFRRVLDRALVPFYEYGSSSNSGI